MITLLKDFACLSISLCVLGVIGLCRSTIQNAGSAWAGLLTLAISRLKEC